MSALRVKILDLIDNLHPLKDILLISLLKQKVGETEIIHEYIASKKEIDTAKKVLYDWAYIYAKEPYIQALEKIKSILSYHTCVNSFGANSYKPSFMILEKENNAYDYVCKNSVPDGSFNYRGTYHTYHKENPKSEICRSCIKRQNRLKAQRSKMEHIASQKARAAVNEDFIQLRVLISKITNKIKNNKNASSKH